MKQIKICDVTMGQGSKAFSLSFREKIELAKLLDGLGASVITLEGVAGGKTDALLIKSVAAAVKRSTVAVPVALDQENVQQVWSALQLAVKPRLQVRAAVSSVQMEYVQRKKPEAMLKAIGEITAACTALCPDVELIAEDASRSDLAFLAQAVEAAITAGAKTVTLCDSAGTMLPEEFAAFIGRVYEAIPALRDVCLGVYTNNSLSLADACAIAAVQQGAGEIKTAAYAVDTASMANVARILSARGDALQAASTLQVSQLSRTVDQITWMCQTDRRKTSPFDSGVRQEETIYLTAHDSIGAVVQAVQQLGYDLSEEDVPKVYEAFCNIAAKKEKVGIRELDAIVASAAMQVPPSYLLDSYVINAGNTISSSAHLRLRKEGKVLEGVCLGDGPIDAAFLAIEQITGKHYELDDFQIQAVTEGREAMGQTIVRLRAGGKVYAGRGISTDIVGASIYAYLSALNKIAYEEESV